VQSSAISYRRSSPPSAGEVPRDVGLEVAPLRELELNFERSAVLRCSTSLAISVLTD
jgi:hypothetical protein